MPLFVIRALVSTALVLVSAASASAAAGQQPTAAAYVDHPIAGVTITIEGRPTTDPTLLDAILTRGGAPLRMADIRESITHLYSLGRFDDVQVEAESAADGNVTLVYVLQPIHIVMKVEFRGQLGLSEGALRSRMTERFGARPPVGRSADVAAALVQLYQERGYLSASVKPAPPILAHTPERATLVFDVSAGPRTTIAQTEITGHPLEPIAQLESRLAVAQGQAYEPVELRTRLDEYVTSMRHRRYYEAAAHEQTAPAGPARINLTIDIQPGPLVDVQFTGDPLPKDKIAELVPIEREGSVDQDLLEDASRRITDYLQQQGYWKADVKPPDRQESDGHLTVVFHVNRGRAYRVAPGGVEVTGNQSVSADEIRPLLRMSPGEPFLSSRLSATESAIKQLYRTKGFASAEVASAANALDAGLVNPIVTIKEGPRVVVGSVTIAGNQAVKTDDLLRTLTLKTGEPYYGPTAVHDRDALQAAYLNAGYASVDVTVPPVTSVAVTGGARADIVFSVVEGPQTIVERIFITGNLKTDPAVIQRELRLKPGQPLGLEDVTESKRRLSALGLFSRIQISTVSHGDPSSRDVIVTVEEAQRTTIGYGGGLQVDQISRTNAQGFAQQGYEFAPRGFFEIGRRNIGGHNRSVNFYTRLSLRPNNGEINSSQFGFSEYRVVGTYREPLAFRNYGDLIGTAAVEQGVRTGFNFSRKGLNAELTHRLSPKIRGSARYSFGTTRIFDDTLAEADQLTVDRVFPQVRLSTFSGAAARDTRDDPLEPQHGTLLSLDGTLAARAIGSEVGFTKTFLQGFVYKNLGTPHLVFAAGARLGLASAFLRVVPTTDANGNTVLTEVRDLPASERFFAGGDTTIRGFALDSVGVPSTITATGFPKGGDAEIVLNAELRAPIRGPIGVVVFADGGNVFARAADLDLSQLRGSLGFGVRYRSPIGPIRVDIGFKLDRRTIGGKLEPRYALHFSIGQAF